MGQNSRVSRFCYSYRYLIWIIVAHLNKHALKLVGRIDICCFLFAFIEAACPSVQCLIVQLKKKVKSALKEVLH